MSLGTIRVTTLMVLTAAGIATMIAIDTSIAGTVVGIAATTIGTAVGIGARSASDLDRIRLAGAAPANLEHYRHHNFSFPRVSAGSVARPPLIRSFYALLSRDPQ